MTKTQELLELAERCEKATGPDREIDGAIAARTGWSAKGRDWVTPGGVTINQLPRFTASIDSAITLVPPGWGRHVGNCGPEDCPCACVTQPNEPFIDFAAGAATEPLALCAAALRARSQS